MTFLKKILLPLLILAAVMPAAAQTSKTGRVDVGLLVNRPAACSAGDLYVASDNPTTQYICGPANTWAAVAFFGSGPVSGSGTIGNIPKFTAAGIIGNSSITDNGTTVSTSETLTPQSDVYIKGPVPWADITQFGGRSVSILFPPTATATITGSSTTAHLNSASTFKNGDGITFLQAGATVFTSMTVPPTPSVTPSIAAGGTATNAVVNSSAGSSTYNYVIVARDKYGAFSPTSIAGQTTQGQAALGQNTCPITSMSRSNATITINWTSTCGVTVGSLVHITGSSNADFTGWWSIATTPSGTQSTVTNTPLDSRSIGSNAGDSNSATGGNGVFFLSNHLHWTAMTNAWEYYVFVNRPSYLTGSYTYVGQTKPSANGYIDVDFDDFGAAFMTGQTLPSYIPNSFSVASPWVFGGNDPLTTTIASGGGTTTLTLANAATNTVTTPSTFVFDDAPAISAAYTSLLTGPNSGPGTVYFPAAPVNGFVFGYVVNSYLAIPFAATFVQIGPMTLNETLEFQGATNWFGIGAMSSVPQFGLASGFTVNVGTANPGVYTAAPNVTVNFGNFISGNANGGTLWVIDHPSSVDNFDYVNFDSNQGSTVDYLSMNVAMRTTSTGGNSYYFKKSSFVGGVGATGFDSTWTPLVFYPVPENPSNGSPLGNGHQLSYFNDSWMNRRGIETESAGGDAGLFDFDNFYRQGGITPFFAAGTGTSQTGPTVNMNYVYLDTEAVGAVAMYTSSTSASFQARIHAWDLNDASSDTSGIPQPTTGYAPAHFDTAGSNMGKPPSRESWENLGVQAVVAPYDIFGTNAKGVHDFFTLNEAMHFPSQYPLFWDLPAPTNVMVTGPTSGGTLANGTYQYAVSSIGADQGESAASAIPSSAVTTTTGNNTVSVSWTGVQGAIAYNVYRCVGTGTTCVNSNGTIASSLSNYRLVGFQIAGTSFTNNTSSIGQVIPQNAGTGSVFVNSNGFYGPQYTLLSPLSGGLSFLGQQTAPISANRNWTWPDLSGTVGILPTGTTPANNDCVKWVLSGGVYSLGTIGGGCPSTPAWSAVTPATNSNAGTFAMSGNVWDAHSAAHTLPIKSGTFSSIPGTCTVSEIYFATDATAGQNFYYCTSSNVFTQQLNSGAAGASTALGNLAAVAINTTLLPASVNTVALGSASLPFTNVFLGTTASQAASFSTSSLTANRTINIPDATSTPVRACTPGTNQFMTAIAVATGTCTTVNIVASATMPYAYAADSGSGTAYVVTLTPAVASYTAGLEVDFLPANANSGTTPTLNVNGVGTATITKFGTSALVANDLITTEIAKVIYDGTNWQLQNPATVANGVTASSSATFTNKIYNAESTGNALSEPVKAFFKAAVCGASSTAGPALDLGASNQPTAQCTGSTVSKGVLKFARGNVAYINYYLPVDWNSSAATDIQACFTTTDTTNAHVTSFNIQTGFNKVDGTVTDDPSLNGAQALSVTTGASQVSGGELCGSLTSMTMTGGTAGYNMEIAVTRNNSGTDTNTDTGVALKELVLTYGVTKNASNR